MSAAAAEPEPEEPFEDLLPDELRKKGATPLKRTPAQIKRAAERERAAQEKAALEERGKRLAQIVNLHIGGFSLAEIGASIGASEAEVERMLMSDTARYVKTQPALRTYVRNWISEKYTGLLEADWEEATDRTHKEKLEHQDRVIRILDRMARLHGADAPTQTEMKIEAAPEAVDALVQRLAAGHGFGYDTTIFDVVPGEVVSEAHEAAAGALEVSGNAADESDGDDVL